MGYPDLVSADLRLPFHFVCLEESSWFRFWATVFFGPRRPHR